MVTKRLIYIEVRLCPPKEEHGLPSVRSLRYVKEQRFMKCQPNFENHKSLILVLKSIYLLILTFSLSNPHS